MTSNYILYKRPINIKKTMCERSAIYCWSNVYTVGSYFIQRCLNVIFAIWRGVSNPTRRSRVAVFVIDLTSKFDVRSKVIQQNFDGEFLPPRYVDDGKNQTAI